MTSDTARRLAEKKYPWQGHGGSYDRETDLKRTAFLAGWDAAIEHAAQVAELIVPDPHGPGEECSDCAMIREAVAVIRAERSDR